MTDLEDKADRCDVDWLQEQIYELQKEIRDLQMENTLLRNDLNTIKLEGCWRFVENPKHIHKDSNEK